MEGQDVITATLNFAPAETSHETSYVCQILGEIDTNVAVNVFVDAGDYWKLFIFHTYIIHLSNPPIHSFIHFLSIHTSVHQYPSICSYVCLSIHSSTHLPIHPFLHTSICPFIRLFIYHSICILIYPSICPLIHLTVPSTLTLYVYLLPFTDPLEIISEIRDIDITNETVGDLITIACQVETCVSQVTVSIYRDEEVIFSTIISNNQQESVTVAFSLTVEEDSAGEYACRAFAPEGSTPLSFFNIIGELKYVTIKIWIMIMFNECLLFGHFVYEANKTWYLWRPIVELPG